MGSSNLSPVVSGSSNVTSPVAWTPVGSWVSGCSYEGFYWREGKFLCCEGTIRITSSVTATQLTITLPNAYTIDTSIPSSDFNAIVVGSAYLADATINGFLGVIIPSTTTKVSIHSQNATLTSLVLGAVNNTTPFTFGASDLIGFNFKVPINQFS